MDLFLSKLANSVSSAGDLESLTRPLLELLETVTGLESTYLTTVDEVKGVQYILYSRNSSKLKIPENLSVPWEDTLCKRALEENRPYTDDVGSCWGDSDAARALGIKTYLSQPVRNLDGGLYGTLCGASADAIAVPPEVVKVLNLFAQLIGRQVDRERQLQSLQKTNQELQTHALTDPLTGVANRRALIDDLRRLLAQAKREQKTLLVAFIDLDGFKAINDRHGHDVGDRFLIHIASRLVSGTRGGDLVGRYGGDEFAVVTQGGDPQELRSRLQQMTVSRFASNGVSFDYQGASVGVVASELEEADAEQLLSRADAAMYEVKKQRKALSTKPTA